MIDAHVSLFAGVGGADLGMGWPDDHTRYRLGPDGTVVEQADSNRYRQCGNGMAAPVVAWIAHRIVEADQ